MVHTYRDPQVARSSFIGSPLLRSFVFFCLITVGFFALTGFRFTRDGATFLGGPFLRFVCPIVGACRFGPEGDISFPDISLPL